MLEPEFIQLRQHLFVLQTNVRHRQRNLNQSTKKEILILILHRLATNIVRNVYTVLHVKSIIKIVEFSQICQSWKFSARGFFPEPEFFWRSWKNRSLHSTSTNWDQVFKSNNGSYFQKRTTLPKEKISAIRRGRKFVSDNSKCIRTPKGGRGSTKPHMLVMLYIETCKNLPTNNDIASRGLGVPPPPPSPRDLEPHKSILWAILSKISTNLQTFNFSIGHYMCTRDNWIENCTTAKLSQDNSGAGWSAHQYQSITDLKNKINNKTSCPRYIYYTVA